MGDARNRTEATVKVVFRKDCLEIRPMTTELKVERRDWKW